MPNAETKLKISIYLAALFIGILMFLIGLWVVGPYVRNRLKARNIAPYEQFTSEPQPEPTVPEPITPRPRFTLPESPKVAIIPTPTSKTEKPTTKTQEIPTQPKKEEKPTPPKEYKIQVGVFSEKPNAEALIKELTEKGYQATATEETQEDGTIRYRVHIGPFKDKAQAEKIAQELQDQGYSTYIPPE